MSLKSYLTDLLIYNLLVPLNMRSTKCSMDSLLKKQQPFLNQQIMGENSLKIEEKGNIELCIRAQEAKTQSGPKSRIQASSKKESAKNSTAKYREKKKKELDELQQSVKQLQNEISSTSEQIQNVKQSILTALESLSKVVNYKVTQNQRATNENVEIYNQLESLIGKSNQNNNQQLKQYTDYEVDFDKINLLLDTLKYRIGANGRQRQTKLAYHFKSIVNTLFPALYRYVLFACIEKIDLFGQSSQENKNDKWAWTNQMIKTMDFDQKQVEQMRSFSQRLNNVFSETISGVKRLHSIKGRLKKEGQKIQRVEEEYRERINPTQCAHWIIFAQKYKYRKQLLLDKNFGVPQSMKSEELDEEIKKNMQGRKRVKLSSQHS